MVKRERLLDKLLCWSIDLPKTETSNAFRWPSLAVIWGTNWLLCPGFSTGSALTHRACRSAQGRPGFEAVDLGGEEVDPNTTLCCLTGPSHLSPGTSVPSWEALPGEVSWRSGCLAPVHPPHLSRYVPVRPRRSIWTQPPGVRKPRQTHTFVLSYVITPNKGPRPPFLTCGCPTPCDAGRAACDSSHWQSGQGVPWLHLLTMTVISKKAECTLPQTSPGVSP